MANKNTLANVPNFFKGTYEQLTTALAPGGLFYPLDKVAYGYVTDRNCLFYCDIDGNINLVGDSTSTVIPESGTIGNPIILDELPPGVYSINGTYQATATEPPISISANQLFIIGDNGTITQMNGEAMTKQIVTSGGIVVEETYVTDADIIRSYANKQDVEDLFL